MEAKQRTRSDANWRLRFHLKKVFNSNIRPVTIQRSRPFILLGPRYQLITILLPLAYTSGYPFFNTVHSLNIRSLRRQSVHILDIRPSNNDLSILES